MGKSVAADHHLLELLQISNLLVVSPPLKLRPYGGIEMNVLYIIIEF